LFGKTSGAKSITLTFSKVLLTTARRLTVEEVAQVTLFNYKGNCTIAAGRVARLLL